jgi:hypothetical protein
MYRMPRYSTLCPHSLPQIQPYVEQFKPVCERKHDVKYQNPKYLFVRQTTPQAKPFSTDIETRVRRLAGQQFSVGIVCRKRGKSLRPLTRQSQGLPSSSTKSMQPYRPSRQGISGCHRANNNLSPLFRFPETIFGLAAASPFSADRFFQPGIDHRASCNFCIFARAENCPLLGVRPGSWTVSCGRSLSARSRCRARQGLSHAHRHN